MFRECDFDRRKKEKKMKTESWTDFIFPWLKALNGARQVERCGSFSYREEAKRNKYHILIVEGKTDKDFFGVFLTGSRFIYQNQSISFKTDEKSILMPFDQSYSRCKNSNPWRGPDCPNDYLHYEAVVEILRTFNEMKEQINSIDCYGLIDRDLGHENIIENVDNIGMTQYHDREPSILRYCLPEFVKRCQSKETSVNVLSKIINFCFKQGVVEQTSHSFETDNGSSQFYKESLPDFRLLSHKYFMDRSKDFNFSENEKFFDGYLKQNGWREAFDYYKKRPRNEENVDDFVDEANDLIASKFKFEKRLHSILDDWLIEGKRTFEKEIDNFFKTINGHIFLNQMALNSSYFSIKLKPADKGCLDLSSDKKIIDYFLRYILVENGKEYQILFNDSPLNEYKKYREFNHFYSVENQSLMPEKKANPFSD